MDSTTDDAALVYAARDGNTDAFTELLVRHWSLLLSVCRRMVGDADRAHDMAQEAALRAFLSLDRLKRAEQFGPWLSGIGLNTCRHWLRQQRQSTVSWDAIVGGRYSPTLDIPDERLGPAECADVADLRERVQRAIADLPPGQRAAIVLYYLDGLTYAETAAHLGIAISAVKTRLHKARGTLRQHLFELWKEQEMTTPTQSSLVDMQIESVRKNMEDPDNPRHVVILQEAAGSRYLLIWMGVSEAEALTNALENREMPRPMTFAFMANLLQAADVTVREVHINKLVDDVYYARAVIEVTGEMRTVDARPSDALNLAALVGAPIRVARDVLEAASVVDRLHLDPVSLAPLRVVTRHEWKTTSKSASTET